MTETEAEAALPDFPFSRESPTRPAAEYAERRATCPFGKVRLSSGHEAVLLVTYRDAAAAMADTRLSHNLCVPGAPRLTRGPSLFDDPTSLINKEGEEHLRIRRIVASAFTPRRIERWRPTIAQVAGELLDAVVEAGSPADLVTAYCFPLPGRIICRLLGVPEQDMPLFREWSGAFLSAARMTLEKRIELLGQFTAYGRGLIARRRAEPGDDLIDDLIAARDGADKLSEDELMMLVTGLVAAGNETTANMLGRSVLALLADDGALWDQLAGRPELLPAAVDELLRHVTLGGGAGLRLATADVDLPSGTVQAGQAVVIAGSSAHRDEAAYEDPDSIRFDRDGPAPLTFGGGPHYCLGAHLAKAELQVGLGTLIDRFPKLRLAADPGQLRFSEGEILSSLISLPVAWLDSRDTAPVSAVTLVRDRRQPCSGSSSSQPPRCPGLPS
jgi:cytochrome P450